MISVERLFFTDSLRTDLEEPHTLRRLHRGAVMAEEHIRPAMVQRVSRLLDGLMRREMMAGEGVAKNVVAVIEAGSDKDPPVMISRHGEHLLLVEPHEPRQRILWDLREILLAGLILRPADAHQLVVEKDVGLGQPGDALRPDAAEEAERVGAHELRRGRFRLAQQSLGFVGGVDAGVVPFGFVSGQPFAGIVCSITSNLEPLKKPLACRRQLFFEELATLALVSKSPISRRVNDSSAFVLRRRSDPKADA